jgi:gliding motility-associated-like protein
LADAANNYNVVVTGLCPSAQTSIDAAVVLQTPPTITTQPSSQTLCLGNAAALSVSATGTGLSYQWRKGIVNLLDGANISGSSTAILSINPTTLADAANNYNVVVTGLCPSTQTSIDAAVVLHEVPAVEILTDSNACLGNDLQLLATAIDSMSYAWSGPNNFSSTSSNPILSDLGMTQAGVYQLIVSVFNCSTAPLFLDLNIVDCDTIDFFIPEGFSPNNDGINDRFVIRGIEDYPESSLVVYSRWGDKLHEANAAANEWDGTSSFGLIFGSELLPVGNYFYVLQLNNQADDLYKGIIYLSR